MAASRGFLPKDAGRRCRLFTTVHHTTTKRCVLPCGKLKALSLLKHVNTPLCRDAGAFCCLHFVYLLKHISLTCMEKGLFILANPGCCICSVTPLGGALHWAKLSLRHLVLLYKDYSHRLCASFFRRIVPALYIWVALGEWVSLFKPLYRMFL